MHKKTWFIILAIVALVAASLACGNGAAPEVEKPEAAEEVEAPVETDPVEEPVDEPHEESVAEPEGDPTDTPEPTDVPSPSPTPEPTDIPAATDTPEPVTEEFPITGTIIDIPALLDKDAFQIREAVTDLLGEPDEDMPPDAILISGSLHWEIPEYGLGFGFNYLDDGRVDHGLYIVGFRRHNHSEEDLLRAGNLDTDAPDYRIHINPFGESSLIPDMITVYVIDPSTVASLDIIETEVRQIVRDTLGGNTRDVPRVHSVELASDGPVYVRWAINDSLTAGMRRYGAKLDITKVAEALCKAGYCDGLTMEGTFLMRDVYGNWSEDVVVQVGFSPVTLSRINWAGFRPDDIYAAADTARMHPEFQD